MSRDGPRRVRAIGPGWQGAIDPGETRLWEGHPQTKPGYHPLHLVTGGIGLVMLTFGVPAVQMMGSLAADWPRGAGAGETLLFSAFLLAFGAFGLLWFLGGVGLLLGPPFYTRFAPQRVSYLLTNRHAYVESRWLLRHISRVPLAADRIATVERENGEAHVAFWEDVSVTNSRIVARTDARGRGISGGTQIHRSRRAFAFLHLPPAEARRVATLARNAAGG